MRQHDNTALERYIRETFAHESALLSHVRDKGEALVPGMQLSPNEGRLLQCLCQSVQAKHVLEIGMFVGYSALWMADALPDDGSITTLEYNTQHVAVAREHFDAYARPDLFQIIEGKALDSLHRLAADTPSYDVVFMDAAKSEYVQYLALVSPMIRRGGMLIADNTLLFGHMIDNPLREATDAARYAMKEFNQTLGKSAEFTAILLPTLEGLTIAVKN